MIRDTVTDKRHLGIPIEEIWEAYGGFLIQFTMETGWDELLRAMAPDLEVTGVA